VAKAPPARLELLQATIPHLTRSSLHRCLQRHGISRLAETEGEKPVRKKFKALATYAYACRRLPSAGANADPAEAADTQGA
jgi:hypothetical protein